MRKVIFWLHLVIGLVAGVVIFVLCLTGALLVFEKEIDSFFERDPRGAPPTPDAVLVSPEVLLASAAKTNSHHATNIEWFADPRRPVRVFYDDRSVILLNGWTGEVIGPGANRCRGFFFWVTKLHTNLVLPGTGKWMVDVSNAAFVLLTVSGLWIWWPRQWRWKALRSSMAMRFDLGGKARDWNWHNALGFWFLIPLFLVAITGVVLSYKPIDLWWRAFAKERVLAAARPVTPATAAEPTPDWNAVLGAVGRDFPGWRSMLLASTAPRGPVNLIVRQGPFGQRAKIRNVTINRTTNAIVKISAWENDDPGTRARAIARFGHTGEILGRWGQILGLLACAAGLVLVYTGFALSYRRFFRRSAPAA
jgi:uncharacterized iron-regulated membrane protein